mmetsp:Transcript_9836/g.30947  ORF Transcript_9836/g.30947 Transcript_9836/m.30947 type:complete len:263 (-) Transcript_9836:1603-2391(-)
MTLAPMDTLGEPGRLTARPWPWPRGSGIPRHPTGSRFSCPRNRTVSRTARAPRPSLDGASRTRCSGGARCGRSRCRLRSRRACPLRWARGQLPRLRRRAAASPPLPWTAALRWAMCIGPYTGRRHSRSRTGIPRLCHRCRAPPRTPSRARRGMAARGGTRTRGGLPSVRGVRQASTLARLPNSRAPFTDPSPSAQLPPRRRATPTPRRNMTVLWRLRWPPRPRHLPPRLPRPSMPRSHAPSNPPLARCASTASAAVAAAAAY